VSLTRLVGLALFAGLLALLTGCTSSDATGTDAADSGVEVSTDTETAPEITIPDGDPPEELVVEVVVEGDGDEVKSGDLLVADYVGQLWDTGEEFDSSWSRGEPAAFAIGAEQVIAGWDEGLVGQKVGSRVLLVIPPDLGYGDEESGPIPAGSTLVFVVDIRDSFSTDDAVGGTPVTDLPAGLPTVTGEPGEEPTVDVDGVEAPTQSTSVVVVEGSGDPIGEDANLVAHAVQVSLDTGEVLASTWEETPLSLPAAGLPGLSEALEGQAAGTRVVTVLTEEDGQGQAVVLVLDILGSY